MRKRLCLSLYMVLLVLCTMRIYAQPTRFHGLQFKNLPQVWDEGIPLGNGIMGTLIWEKEGKLRLAFDRADLWDLRPVEEFNSPSYSYSFICDEVIDRKDVSKVHALIDARTRKDIAPTKIPAGALEFITTRLGKVKSVKLDVHTAVCTIAWEGGTIGHFYTGATDKVGHFRFENLPDTLSISLQTPRFEEDGRIIEHLDKNRTNMLTRLGYKNGEIIRKKNNLIYRQKAYGEVSYEVALQWQYPDSQTLEGVYCLTTVGTWYSESKPAAELMKAYNKDFRTALKEHSSWWSQYWSQCEIQLPDSILENQWYLEMYKFGASSRKNAPPICLQAVWTADNGQTPPWRGDFHSDLNTQLSYWPGYSSNHLEESSVFTDWLCKIKENGEQFTRRFFGVEGLNIPCVATLEGKAIGGWSPYSHQPSTSGWLTQHFYLQWKYSADSIFLRDKAYPWVKEVARYFENISVRRPDGKRKLPLSTSPEINDNSLESWFQETTNYDLASIRFTYTIAAEMAATLGYAEDAARWQKQLTEWPDLAIGSNGLTIAPNYPLSISHRHFSHMLGFHPLGLLDVSQGKDIERLIKRSIHHIEELGSEFWTGYSYTWLANMKARVFDGDAAARALHIFTKAFCSPNSFHLNGDQLKKNYSSFTYRPFTLEGNFAYASAIQEMLLQSHTGVIRVFPAIPESWKNVSFNKMRAMGAFLVSAVYKDGKVKSIKIRSEQGGMLKVIHPITGEIIEKKMNKEETIQLL
ncbi:MAG: hypothetical protein RSO15_02635 [Bacteroides sp.]|uniref:glycosyl hydrolase family 95 catalytic domain-containing protein n=1 Tax=Bacteroides sp. TaxID=29523 RepID=UPI002FC5F863